MKFLSKKKILNITPLENELNFHVLSPAIVIHSFTPQYLFQPILEKWSRDS